MEAIKVVGRNVEVTGAIQEHVEKRLEKLERFFHQIMDAKVMLTVKAATESSRRNKVEMQIHVPHGIIRAEEARPDMYQAIDAASDVLERQLKKFREKFITRTHRGEAPPVVEISSEEEFQPEIVRVKNFELRPMSPEDAAAQMEALDHDFFVFTHSRSNATSVIYRRRDGNYGLIEPRMS